MNSQQTLATFAVVALFCLGVVWGEDSGRYGYNKKGELACNGLEAITVMYDSDNRVEMRCMVPIVCNKPGVVDLVTRNCDSGDGRFLLKATEVGTPKSGTVNQRCNKYVLPRKGKYSETCLSTFVKDSVLAGGQGGRRKRLKRAAGNVIKADIYNSLKSEGITGPFLPVKSIKKQSGGYLVTMCQVNCWESNEEEEPEEQPEETPEQESPPQESPSVPETGSAAANCFSADDTVQTMNGPVAMKDLKVGDKVQTYASVVGQFATYEPVNWFIHREPEREAEFVTLATASGRSLALTGGHLVPVIPCDQAIADPATQREVFNGHMVPARQVELANNTCLLVEDGVGAFSLEPLAAVARSSKAGIYAPVTSTGNLVVNGVAVSCFSEVDSHVMQAYAMPALLGLKDAAETAVGMLGLGGGERGNGGEILELPLLIRFFVESSGALLG